MAGETINTDAVDRVLAETPPAPIDEVKVRAADLVELRRKAALADTLQRDAASTLTAAAITEATSAVPFVDDVAASHARTLLRERVIVRPGEDGRLVALDRETGRPAAAVLKELVTSAEYSRYIRANHAGGGGGGNTPPDRPGQRDGEAHRRAMAERMLAGRGGMPDQSYGGFANGRGGA